MTSLVLKIAVYAVTVASSTVAHHIADRNQSSCCTALSRSLGEELSYPTDLPYMQSLASYYAQQEASLSPACIFKPKNADQVSAAVKVLSSLDLSDQIECKFAVRGGGQNPAVGSANINEGVTIDLSSMRQVEVSLDRTVAFVGPGSRWGDVYLELDAMNLTVAGGRVFTVGVGGLIIGGGISFLSPRKGFVCDNVKNFEVVLPNGQIVNANAKENRDLWIALRGGTNNFGIVTRFDLKTFPQGKFWGGTITYDHSTAPKQLVAFHDFGTATNYDEFASMFQVHGFTAGKHYVLNSLTYTKPESNPAVYRSFTEIKPQLGNNMRFANHTEFTLDVGAAKALGARNMFYTTTFQNNLSFLLSVLELWKTFTADIASTPGLVASALLEPLVVPMTEKSRAQGGNSLGLAANERTLVILLVSITWTSPLSDSRIGRHAQRLLDAIDARAKARGVFHPFKYANYAARFQQPFAGYGDDGRDRLRNVSRKYDPHALFQRAVPGGFKLFES